MNWLDGLGWLIFAAVVVKAGGVVYGIGWRNGVAAMAGRVIEEDDA